MSSPMKYFRLTDDMTFPGRWFLNGIHAATGQSVDPRVFTSAAPVSDHKPVRVSVRVPGTPLDFTLGDFDVPVITAAVARILEPLASADLQLMPARIEGVAGDHEILNVVHAIACLDERRSEFIRWTEADGRPDKIGQYRMVTKLHVDPVRVGPAQVFRIDGWKVALVVSEAIRAALVSSGLSGMVFTEV